VAGVGSVIGGRVGCNVTLYNMVFIIMVSAHYSNS